MTDTTIKLRRSAVKGKQPSTSQLELGELAINTVDGKVYLKQKDSDGIGGAESIVEIGGGGGGTLQPSGTPVDNQIAVWTSGTELEGDANLTWDATTFNVTGLTTLDSTTIDGTLTVNDSARFGVGFDVVIRDASGTNGQVLIGTDDPTLGGSFQSLVVNGNTSLAPTSTGDVLRVGSTSNYTYLQTNTSSNTLALEAKTGGTAIGVGGNFHLVNADEFGIKIDGPTGDVTIDKSLQVDSDVNVTGNLDVAGLTTLDSTTIDGRLTANGGINGLTLANGGITGNNFNIEGVNVISINDPGEGIVFQGNTSGDITLAVLDDTSDNILQVTGGANTTFQVPNLNATGITTLDSTTIDGNLSVSGNLTVSGTRTEINVDALNISDALIILGDSNTNTDVVDIGFYGKYYNSTAGVGKTERAGLFRDAGDGNFYLFTGLRDSATDAATVINRAGTNYTDATLVAGNLTLSGLSTQASETTALMIDGSNIVGTRDLGTGAFTAAYSLPLSADGTRGGVQIGYAENGKNYPVELSSEKMYVNVPWTDTVYTHPDHTGDVTSTGDGATVIANDAVTYAKIQNVVNDERILGRVSGANGVIEELTKSDVLTMLNVADGAEVNVATDLSYTASTRVLASSTGTDATLPEVVAAGNSGLMTGADKTKLDGIATGAEVNVATNITITENATTVTVASSTGSNDNIAGATASLSGVVTNTTQTFGGDKTFSNDVNVTGTLTATAKSFDIPHPSKERMRLRYGSLEGPENGVYVRGQLNGTMEIVLPDYWMQLVDPNSITVNLTSIGPDPVWVEHIQDNVVTIGGSGKCFYHIYAERVDIEKLEVEYRV